MVIDIYLYLLSLITLALCVNAAWHDVKSLTIHNGTVMGILLVFCVAYAINTLAVSMEWIELPFFASVEQHLLSSFFVFIICFALFWMGVLGGGDAKMASALALWIPLNALPGFVMIMALIGGALGFSALILKGKKEWLKPTSNQGWIAALSRGESTVPYGVALMVAAVYSFVQLGYLGV